MFRSAFRPASGLVGHLVLRVAIATAMAAVRVPEARPDESSRIAPPDSVVKRGEWSLVLFGGKVGGFDYETNLEQAGLGDDVAGGCANSFFGPQCWSGREYPQKLPKEGKSAAIQLSIQASSRWQVSLLGSSTSLMGWEGRSSADGSLSIQARSRSISALAGWGKPFRIAIGPALVERMIVFNFDEYDSDVALGAVGEVGLRKHFSQAWMFDVAARYQWAGSRSATHTVGFQNFEASDLSFSHASFMIGVGVGGGL